MGLSPKERLLKVLKKEKVDRPPVICPGGMMSSAIVEIMEKTGHTWPAAHSDATIMAALAEAVYEHTGFENLGVPYCMTVEAEVLGSKINFGDLICEPKIEKEAFASVAQVEYGNLEQKIEGGRIGAIVEAVSILVKKYSHVPVIGNLTGPLSTAASLVDPIQFLKELRKDQENSHKVLNYVAELLIKYAERLVEAGADLIAIADPTASGEILGPQMFAQYAVPYINKVVDGIKGTQTPVVVHICGNIKAVKHLIPQIRFDVISTDAAVNLRLLKAQYPELITMGNLSTFLLRFGTPEKVAGQTERLVQSGIDIIAPACGLSTLSPLENIVAMTSTVKNIVPSLKVGNGGG